MAIIDLSMPGMDGWRLLQSIHANPTLAEMSCVAMTAYHDRRVEQEAYKAGFKAYFPKPLSVAFPEQIESLLET
jgi:CheY-like chemotaxis protein